MPEPSKASPAIDVSPVEVARALQRATDPAELRTAWVAIQAAWAASYQRVARMPGATVDISVAGEWSYAQTLRHLVFATDAWLGAILGQDRPFHPWGVPFSELEEYAGPASDLGVDLNVAPSYAAVLQLRADRVAKVSDYLADVTPEHLAEQCRAPVWDDHALISRVRCVWVIFNEELEHLGFAERDLNVIAERTEGS